MSGTMRRTAILCVDDEEAVLRGLMLQLRQSYDVRTATSGQEALTLLDEDSSVAIVLSDMRMPNMDGAELLLRIKKSHPSIVRMLLTGETDILAAAKAVNEGGLFRFLTKPCPAKLLLAALSDAERQHRMATAERVLLQETLLGAIRSLSDILALTSPTAFGRATRITLCAKQLAEALELGEPWSIEAAAMLSQIGFVSLPPPLVEKVYRGVSLDEGELAQVSKVSVTTRKLLGHIPRLEPVLETLELQATPFVKLDPDSPSAPGASVLRIAVDYDLLEAELQDPQLALDTMRNRPGIYNPDYLAVFCELRDGRAQEQEVLELSPLKLRPGMLLAEDLKTRDGRLLVSRGYEVNANFLARIANYKKDLHGRVIKAIVQPDAHDDPIEREQGTRRPA